MDTVLARALAALRRGDALYALKVVGSRGDPMALALRGVALAQIDEPRAARDHLRRADRGFTSLGQTCDALRSRLAEAEIAVADLDLSYARTRLLSIAQALRRAKDPLNATWALVVATRAASLQGDAEGAELLLSRCLSEARRAAPHVGAVLAIAQAELFASQLRATPAVEASRRALRLARLAAHPTLVAEATRVGESLRAPVARLVDGRTLTISEVASLVGSTSARRPRRHILVDACRARILGPKGRQIDLARRPVLFDLLAEIAQAAPAAVSSDSLARTVFGARLPNASHDARLRVEIGRLRTLLGRGVGKLVHEARSVRWETALPLVVLLPLAPRHEARLRAILADGRAWPVGALAPLFGQGLRTLQRRLGDLVLRGEVTTFGRGRARRYALEGRAPRIASWMLLAGLASGS